MAKRNRQKSIVVRPKTSPGLEILVNGPDVTMRDVREEGDGLLAAQRAVLADLVSATCGVVGQAREQLAEAKRTIAKAGEES